MEFTSIWQCLSNRRSNFLEVFELNIEQWAKKTIWIVKSKRKILDWYLSQRIFAKNPFVSQDDTSLIHYESLVSNYVAHHADMFTGVQPRHIWYDLDLYDWRLEQVEDRNSKPNPSSRAKPDLILQFDEELWMVEVKFGAKSPDIECQPILETLKPVINQVSIYAQQLQNLLKLEWFPDCKKIQPVVFWAYFHNRLRSKTYLDTKYSNWPAESE